MNLIRIFGRLKIHKIKIPIDKGVISFHLVVRCNVKPVYTVVRENLILYVIMYSIKTDSVELIIHRIRKKNIHLGLAVFKVDSCL